MLVALLGYVLWLALLVRTGLIESDTPNRIKAAEGFSRGHVLRQMLGIKMRIT